LWHATAFFCYRNISRKVVFCAQASQTVKTEPSVTFAKKYRNGLSWDALTIRLALAGLTGLAGFDLAERWNIHDPQHLFFFGRNASKIHMGTVDH
jgi:hypothetical protein